MIIVFRVSYTVQSYALMFFRFPPLYLRWRIHLSSSYTVSLTFAVQIKMFADSCRIVKSAPKHVFRRSEGSTFSTFSSWTSKNFLQRTIFFFALKAYFEYSVRDVVFSIFGSALKTVKLVKGDLPKMRSNSFVKRPLSSYTTSKYNFHDISLALFFLSSGCKRRDHYLAKRTYVLFFYYFSRATRLLRLRRSIFFAARSNKIIFPDD